LRLSIAPYAGMILFVGNLAHVKGVDALIESLGTLAQQGVSFRCYLVGDGALRPQLESAAATRAPGRVEFVGAVDHDRLPDWFRAADVFVLPSRSEGVPNVLLEAAACGTPWVASAVGGVPEIARSAADRLVPPQDAPALAAALHEVLATPRPSGSFDAPRVRSHAEAAAEIVQFLQQTVARHHAVHGRVA
jgi:glycosyltransferase involved in cell wall biosynthesis